MGNGLMMRRNTASLLSGRVGKWFFYSTTQRLIYSTLLLILFMALCITSHAFAPGIIGVGGKVIVTYSIAAAGNGYAVDDVLTISDGLGGQITVTANAGYHCSVAGDTCQISSSYCEVTCSGIWQAGTGVSASTLLNGGHGYTLGNHATTGGTGTGCIVNVLSVK